MKKGTIRVPYYNHETHKQESKEVQCLIHDCGLAVHRSVDTWLTQHQTSGYAVTHIQSGKRVMLTVLLSEAKQAVCMLAKLTDWNKDKQTIHNELRSKRVEISTIRGELGL